MVKGYAFGFRMKTFMYARPHRPLSRARALCPARGETSRALATNRDGTLALVLHALVCLQWRWTPVFYADAIGIGNSKNGRCTTGRTPMDGNPWNLKSSGVRTPCGFESRPRHCFFVETHPVPQLRRFSDHLVTLGGCGRRSPESPRRLLLFR